jgi:predicted HNH restriction endonuclease
MVSVQGAESVETQKYSKEARVIEVRGNCNEEGPKEFSGNQGEDQQNMGIVKNEAWNRDEIWKREPTAETVERLIEWFSDERN